MGKKNISLPVIQSAVILALWCTATLLGFDRVVNYRSTIGVNAFALDGNSVWVATGGGLYCWNRATGTGTLFSDPVIFPDPEITTLIFDRNGILWIGTAQGYLYQRTRSGNQTVFNTYHMTGWKITALDTLGPYLIVGTSNGCSIFDTKKHIALKNATSFADNFPIQVDAIAAFKDTLLLGTSKGIIKLGEQGRPLLQTITDANFYDRTIWTIDSVNIGQVRSIVVSSDQYRCFPTPAAAGNGKLYTGQKNEVHAEGKKIDTVASTVSTLFFDSSVGCLIGTEKTGFYEFNETGNFARHVIDGPVFPSVDDILLDSRKTVWVSSPVSGAVPPNKPWEGYSAFVNGQWRVYSPATIPAISWMGQGLCTGLAEDARGRVWFGSEGGSVKCYTPSTNTWQKYCTYAGVDGVNFSANTNGICENNWATTYAITADSSGFLWIGCYNNEAGSLIGYDARQDPNPEGETWEAKHYRRFWPKGDPQFAVEKNEIKFSNTDVAGNTMVGYVDGTIVVFSHDGNPLRDGIRIKSVFSENTAMAFDAVSTPDSLTRIATASGFYTYNARDNRFLKGLCIITPSPNGGPGQVTVVDSAIREISALQAEDEKVLWLGTLNSGIIRYDLSAGTKTIIDRTQGLLSDRIRGLALDRAGGQLWIASERGVSRYAIGYRIGVKNTGAPAVYPNPFSKRRHREVVFEKLSPGSRVNLYTASGTLVGSLAAQETSVYGSACIWKPSPALVPGIYLYTIRSSSTRSQGRVLVTP